MAGNAEAGERLALTLAGSLILHFALIFGLQIRAQPGVQAPAGMIQARLVKAVPAAAPAPSQDREQTPPERSTAVTVQAAKPVPPEPEAAPLAPGPQQAAPAAGFAPPAESPGLPSIAVPLIEDPTYYSAKEVDLHPAALQAILPVYPTEAASASVTGSVVLMLLLDESGKVLEVFVEEANPPGYFEKSATEAFRNARFTPAQRHGRAVKSRVLIKVNYDLTGKKDLIDKPR